MSNDNLTDAVYEKVTRLEKKKRRLTFVIMASLFASLSVLGINTFLYMAYTHQKAGVSGGNLITISIFILICLIVIALGINWLLQLRKLNSRLNQFENLEETIYQEVMRSKQAS
jgi:multisubunit Na+/H+ antiporter MnhB subunit